MKILKYSNKLELYLSKLNTQMHYPKWKIN